MTLSNVSSTPINIERFAVPRNIDRRLADAFNTPIPSFRANIMLVAAEAIGLHWSVSPVDFPNQMYAGAIDVNTIKRDIVSMVRRNRSDPDELSDAAMEAIALAIRELDAGTSKTFDDIDEFFDDLDSD